MRNHGLGQFADAVVGPVGRLRRNVGQPAGALKLAQRRQDRRRVQQAGFRGAGFRASENPQQPVANVGGAIVVDFP